MGAYNERVSSEWPSYQRVGKWRILNQILSKYAILEGFWVICDAWPYGYLILCRFQDEKFCGDIIYPLPTVIGKDNRQRNIIRYRNLTERIFEISFADDTGEESCKVLSSQTAAHFGIQEESVVIHNLCFPRNRGLLFEISDISEANYEDEDDENEGIITADGDTMPPIKSLISDMMNNEHRFLMEYLDGPNGRPISDATACQMKESMWIDSNMPLIKPGLYVGSYGTHYGFRQHEIIQIRYFEISDNGRSQEDQRQVLNDAFGGRIPSDFSTKELKGEPTFLISARKVTGDTHVPTGEVTWVANISKTIEDSDRPEFVLDHNRQRHNVRRAWPGYGTLAHIIFQMPSWNEGWLYQLEDDEYDGSSRFAFAWSKYQNQKCIILNGLPNYCDSRFWNSSPVSF
jgi:hypothetical protein